MEFFKFQSDSINTRILTDTATHHKALNSNLILLILNADLSIALLTVTFKFQSDSINTKYELQ